MHTLPQPTDRWWNPFPNAVWKNEDWQRCYVAKVDLDGRFFGLCPSEYWAAFSIETLANVLQNFLALVHDCCETFANCFDIERSPDGTTRSSVNDGLFYSSLPQVRSSTQGAPWTHPRGRLEEGCVNHTFSNPVCCKHDRGSPRRTTHNTTILTETYLASCSSMTPHHEIVGKSATYVNRYTNLTLCNK